MIKRLVLLFIFLASVDGCAQPPPVLISLPDFTLTNQSGNKVNKEILAGKVWVADFIFTSCQGVCPLLTQKMGRLQKDLSKFLDHDQMRLVSFSVDPENDTPERLASYATTFKADFKHWFFLTGSWVDTEKTVKEGFKISMGKGADLEVIHSEKFVLVDQQGRIRGYYDADDAGLAAIIKDAKAVLKKG